jgi:NADPH:quinone reductase-like Zn-dependent oxidoreductase
MADTMRAFGLADEQADPGFIEVPVPEPGPGEVRVAVRASSVNGYDTFIAAGMGRGMLEHRYPVVVGKDHSGVIDAVGEGVDRFAVGDEVTGITPEVGHVRNGTYAEFVVVASDTFLEPKPANLDHVSAASVGLAAATAVVSVDTADPKEGETVLIVGATGGVGTYAVQLAAARGAIVVATARPDDDSWIRKLGASDTVDYSRDVAAQMRERHPGGVDALILGVRTEDGPAGLADLVREGGRVASLVGGADADAVSARGIVGTNVYGQADPGAFTRAVDLVARGELAVPITRTYGFEKIPEALGLVGSRSSRGKIAIRID